MPIFVVRVFKSWNSRDMERRWVNSYEISGTGVLADTSAALAAIIAAERTIHLTNTQFLEATVSTFDVESGGYDPLSFVTSDLSGTGSRAMPTNGELMDSNVCYQMKMTPASGRSGRRFYRGCLTEGDVSTGGDGKMSLVPGEVLAEGGSALTAYRSALSTLLAGGSGTFKLVLASPTGAGGSVERVVVSCKPGPITIAKRNHRYFDRA